MNTPPTGAIATDAFVEDLAEHLAPCLEAVVAAREEATPDIQFQSDDVEQCYQWICEELRTHFKPREADKLRVGITATVYWELEAQYYRDAVNKQMWQNARDKYGLDCEPTADGWRSVTRFYQGV